MSNVVFCWSWLSKLKKKIQSFLEVWFICSTFFVAPKRLHGRHKSPALAASKPVRSARLSRRNTFQQNFAIKNGGFPRFPIPKDPITFWEW